MSRINIEDLPKIKKISKEEMKKAMGGIGTGSFHEMNQSYSLQYLAIQQKIQSETREYNLLSNIMKTRHEAAKNAINNIR